MKGFVDVMGYEPYYLINDEGEILSKRKGNRKMKNWVNKSSGYKCITLYNDLGEKKHFSVHRLVALNFIDNPNNYPMCDHINCDKFDNTKFNLRWVTCSANNRNKTYLKNTELPRGVFLTKSGKYGSQIWSDRKKKYLGCYDTEQQASSAYENEYNIIMEEFNVIFLER
tara:strand:+ start:3645 stop:4151 length:507 start_codon:yes stop_codon:yes gene_type:complete